MKTPRGHRLLFAHSTWDALLVLIYIGHMGLIVFALLAFERMSWIALLPLAAASVLLNITNWQCVAHNHIHNPFFRSKLLNRVFSVLNSLSLWIPETIFRMHHLNHHQYNNDVPQPHSTTTRDRSSIYRYSKNHGEPESLWRYSVLGPFRFDTLFYYREAKVPRLALQVWAEAAVLVAFLAFMLSYNYRFFLFFFVPVLLLAQFLQLATNYFEHYGSTPGDRLTDAVSCYSTLYNLMWFNEGYHQEHHFRPNVHWTEVKKLRGQMLPDNERRVVKGAIWTNF